MYKDRRKEIGQIGEQIAATHLMEKGCSILYTNWSTRLGELDIIAKDQETIVFVEVRTTTSTQFGYGFQSIDFRKQQKVKRLAVQYLQQERLGDLPIRFDAISILLNKNMTLNQIKHFEGAF